MVPVKVTTNSKNRRFDIEKIRKTFLLTKFPFDDMDPDLLKISFTPYCIKKKPENIYATCDQQSLEYYGDRILYTVTADIIEDYYGLSYSFDVYKTLSTELTNNRIITDIMLLENACSLLNSGNYTIENSSKFHNECGDTFESLIGALYIHLKTVHPELDFLLEIKNWLLESKYFPYALKRATILAQHKHQTPKMDIFVINDKEKIQGNISEDVAKLKQHLEKNPGDGIAFLRYNDYFDLPIPDKALIISADDDIESIYKSIGWNYKYPSKPGKVYLLKGGPKSNIIIGAGISAKDAINDALETLYIFSYITGLNSVKFNFSLMKHSLR